MQNILLKSAFFIIITASATLSSCTDFLDVNENPNAPISENLSLEAKFPAALIATVNQETGQLNELGAFWGGYWGTTSEGVNLFFNQKTYNGQGMRDVRDGYPIWETSYTTLLSYQLIREQAENEGALFYAGAAKIMQGWHFMRLVDIYNNIPFDEALQGTRYAAPKYEPGQLVYEKSINLISAGIEDIQQAPPGTLAGSDDILFGGDKTLWIKFANTIKLRGLLRQSEAERMDYIQQEIAKIQTEGSGFLNASESALIQPGYLNTTGKLNPFWERYYRNVQEVVTPNYQDIRPTTYAIEQYKVRNDPRMEQLFVSVDGNYNGVYFGDPVINHEMYGRDVTSGFKGPFENNGQSAAIFKSPTQPSVLMTSFESLFLQAEAAQRGWIVADAKELYEGAISESFKYMEVEAFDLVPYLSQSETAYDNTIARILEQKWLALNSISSIEAWNDFRRLGIPDFPGSLQAASPSSRPLRLMYPETERMTNNGEASKQGSDVVIEDRVWWDRK